MIFLFFTKKYFCVKQFIIFHDHGCTTELTERCLKFFNFKYEGMALYDEEAIMDELPASIRRALLLHRYSKTMQKLPFLSGITEVQLAIYQTTH